MYSQSININVNYNVNWVLLHGQEVGILPMLGFGPTGWAALLSSNSTTLTSASNLI